MNNGSIIELLSVFSALTRRHKRTVQLAGVYDILSAHVAQNHYCSMHLSLSLSRTDACGRARGRSANMCTNIHIEPAVAWPLFIVALISISMKPGIPCTENRRRIAVLLYKCRPRECRKYSISRNPRRIDGPFFAPEPPRKCAARRETQFRSAKRK
jgi:hypothetical protein